MNRRRTDWRFGPVIYQIFVDRFAPSTRIDSKAEHYAPPRRLRGWHELPEQRGYNHDERLSYGELDFWGGDLASVHQRLSHIENLGAEVLYLNPIFHAFTNHKYDGFSYFEIDPQFGTKDDLRALCDDLHDRGRRIILDGVFNHLGRRSPLFQRAASSPDHPERHWFYFDDNHRNGYRGWRNGANLPEIRLEHPEVRRIVIDDPDSAVRTWLRDPGIDGWRLDVAPDIGFDFLRLITEAAHEVRPDSCVIGECWNYPEEWMNSLDGVMNMYCRMLILGLLDGRISPARMGTLLERMVEDAGIEGILRSHMVLDNHDLPRIASILPEEKRHVAFHLQFTLPGAPVVYYGSELGMEGGNDPLNRAPMRWDLLRDDNPTWMLLRRLTKLRDENPALRIGDFRILHGERLVAYLRTTDRARETLIVVVNPSHEHRHELLPVRDSRLMDAARVECLLSGDQRSMHSGTIEVDLPPFSCRIYRTLDQGSPYGYSAFKRVR